MVRTRIGTYILLLIAGISLLAVAAMTWGAHVERQSAIRLERLDRLKTVVKLVAATLRSQSAESPWDEAELQAEIQLLAAEADVYLTVVSDGGRVLADSRFAPAQMENLLALSEFRDAAATDFGYSERLLSEDREPTAFVAGRVAQGDRTLAYVRAGLAEDRLASSSRDIFLVVALIAVVAMASATVLTRQVERRVIEPIVELSEACEILATRGNRRQLWNSASDELGQLVRAFQSMAVAVTEREETLRGQANRIETVLGSMVEGVIAVNADRVVLLANQAVRRLLGIRAERIEGRPLIEVTRIRALDQAVQETLTTNKPCSTEFEVTSPFRRVLSIQANRLPGDPCPGVVVVLHDMTELRRLENLRREFVANVSHELKTPLASIRAYAETLQLGAVNDAENRDYFLKQITDQSDRLHELIMDMLQLARVEAGQEVFEITDVSVAETVRGIVEMMRDKAAAKDIRFVVEAADDDLYVRADEEGLRTIVSNLLDNGLKYSGKPGNIVLRWKADATTVAISVEDYGIGIPDEAQSRIFERFYRVDKARSREMGGTGLGLSIVKHLAQSFGGGIELDSQVGRGSIFTIRLKKSEIPTN